MQNRVLTDLITRMNEVALSLVENPAHDFTSYRERVARYNGLKEALEILTHADSEDEH